MLTYSAGLLVSCVVFKGALSLRLFVAVATDMYCAVLVADVLCTQELRAKLERRDSEAADNRYIHTLYQCI